MFDPQRMDKSEWRVVRETGKGCEYTRHISWLLSSISNETFLYNKVRSFRRQSMSPKTDFTEGGT